MKIRDGFGGGAWMYYPDSMLIRAPHGPNELKAIDFPMLSEAGVEQTRKEIFRDTSSKAKLYFCRFQHELDHLRRLLHTGVGLFVHQLESQLPDHCRWIFSCTHADQLDPSRGLVFDDDLVDVFDQKKLSDREVAIRWWFQLESFRKALLDCPESDDEYIAALTFLNCLRDGNAEVEIEAHPVGSPKFADGFELDTLSARSLLEFCAAMREIDYSGAMADENQPWSQLMQQPEYHTVSALWGKVFPDSNLWSVNTEEELERDSFLLVRRAYPLELHAAIDLALWPPLGPEGVVFGPRAYSWADVHPGHRFVRICEWLQAEKVRFSRIGGEDRNERFREFQTRASNHFGWPTADAVATKWRTFNAKLICGEAVESNRLMPIRIEAGQHPRLMAIETLLAARESQPCDLALGNLPEVEREVRNLGLVLRGQDDYLEMTETTEGDWSISPTLVRSLVMGARFLLLGRHYGGDDPRHYRPKVSLDIVTCFAELAKDRRDEFVGWASTRLDIQPS